MLHVQKHCSAKTFKLCPAFAFSDWTVLTKKRTNFCVSYLDELFLGVVSREQVSRYSLKMFSCTQHTEEFEDHSE